jgi:hypothetical protein
MIRLVSRRVGPAAFILFAVSAIPAARADDGHHDAVDNRYAPIREGGFGE